MGVSRVFHPKLCSAEIIRPKGYGLHGTRLRDLPTPIDGPKIHLWVLVDLAAGTFGDAGNKNDVYVIVKGVVFSD